jgi:phosphatidylserine/phosphatidylglycerophosphate/cardiolipin synthase-like enzyme
MPRHPISLRAALAALAALIAAHLLITSLAHPAPPPASGPSVLDTGLVQVFFTTPSLVYPDVPERRPSSPLLQAVVADVDAARRSVDLAVFDLDIGALGEALVRAKQRGVQVRVVLDSENLIAPEMSALAGKLEHAGVALRFDRRSPFMHNKLIVVDEALVWTGSWNFTENDTFRNNNNMLRIVSRRVANAYAAEFAQLFGGRFGTTKARTERAAYRVGPATMAVYFSPGSGAAEDVAVLVSSARRSVVFLAFSVTNGPIAEALAERAAAGVAVRGVVERKNVRGIGSVFGALQAGGVDVLEDGNCYFLHHKLIVIDDRLVISGSYNFTASAERENDENLLVIADAGLARAYREEFERLYAQAALPLRC